jgi:surface polysaccharide O-acyltransferase-like enzyme
MRYYSIQFLRIVFMVMVLYLHVRAYLTIYGMPGGTIFHVLPDAFLAAALPFFSISGFIMAFHLGPQALVAWSVPLHFVAVAAVFAALFVHVYMAAFMPNERPAFFSMFTGKVDARYAYHHHAKWYHEVLDDCLAGRRTCDPPAPEEPDADPTSRP